MSEMILTPVMTSNTEPSGEVSASSYYSNRYPWHAFTQNENGDIYYNWASNGTSGGEWIQYQFTKAQKVTKIDFYNRNASDGYYPTQLTVKGSNDGTNWTELGVYTSFNTGAKARTTLVIAHPSNYKIYRLIFDSMTPSANGYAGASRIDLIGEQPHLKSSGSTEAIRDWLNASLYNKEEIDDLFIRNNQAGLIPYDLTIIGDQPEQFIKLAGQTSGKVYNLCLGGLVGDMYKKTLLYDNNGSPAPKSTNINYLQNISDFDQLMIVFSTVNDGNLSNYFCLSFVDVDLLLELPAFSCTSFFKRYFNIASTETTFNYTSSGEDETSGYDPRIYRIYGIKY